MADPMTQFSRDFNQIFCGDDDYPQPDVPGKQTPTPQDREKPTPSTELVDALIIAAYREGEASRGEVKEVLAHATLTAKHALLSALEQERVEMVEAVRVGLDALRVMREKADEFYETTNVGHGQYDKSGVKQADAAIERLGRWA